MTLNALPFPTSTLPKLKADALVVSSAVAAVPVPLKETVLGELEMSLMTEILPDTAPATFGEKATLNVDCFPAAIVRGSEMPEIVIPATAVPACVTVRFDPPLFDIVTDCDAVPPMLNEPNLIDAGTTEIVAAPDVFCWLDAGLCAPVSPMQPELDRIAKSRRTRAATGIAFMPAERIIVAHFRAQLNHSFIVNSFMTTILVCRKRKGLLSRSTHNGQGSKPTLGAQVRREAAGRIDVALRGPRIRFV
jgi:hypothetical protein